MPIARADLFDVFGRPLAEDEEHDGPRKRHGTHEQERQVRGHSDPFKGLVEAAHEERESAGVPVPVLNDWRIPPEKVRCAERRGRWRLGGDH